jgi:predicted RNA-binding Zn-ribbon protein involved in translation (DUF1610 family)
MMAKYKIEWRSQGGRWRSLPEVYTSLREAEEARERMQAEESGSVVYRVVEVITCPLCGSDRVAECKRGRYDVRCLECGNRWVLTL